MSGTNDDAMAFTSFDIQMALIIPLICTFATCSVAVVNCVYYRQPKIPRKDVKGAGVVSKKDVAVEVPGDTVVMYVELEAHEDEGRMGARAWELDGRSVREMRVV